MRYWIILLGFANGNEWVGYLQAETEADAVRDALRNVLAYRNGGVFIKNIVEITKETFDVIEHNKRMREVE